MKNLTTHKIYFGNSMTKETTIWNMEILKHGKPTHINIDMVRRDKHTHTKYGNWKAWYTCSHLIT